MHLKQIACTMVCCPSTYACTLLNLWSRAAAVRKWFIIIPALVCPVNFIVDAPFGRFSPQSNSSWMFVDGASLLLTGFASFEVF